MCQVAGFTNPCCRRPYVLVSKTPGCPEDWPRSKCPPEYCLQIRQYEPEERSTGVCWRCKADRAGEYGAARDYRIPKIDKAFWDPPLQLRVDQRKKHIENQGRCWYCNAVGGCNGCGSKHIPLKEIPTFNRQPDVCWHCNAHKYCRMCGVGDSLKEEDSLSLGFTPRFKRSQSSTTGESQGRSNTNKKVKIERPDSKASVRSSVSRGAHQNYPGANAAPHPYSNTPQSSNSPLPSTEFAFGRPSNMSSNGGYQSQGFYPSIPSMGSHGWHPVNQSHVVTGMNGYGQATDYENETTSANGQYIAFNHTDFNNGGVDQQAPSIQQYHDAGPGFPSSDQTPMTPLPSSFEFRHTHGGVEDAGAADFDPYLDGDLYSFPTTVSPANFHSSPYPR